jgi:flagellar basal-body rod modification protein FlgD
MTSPINALGGATPTAPTPPTNRGTDAMGSDTFLKLLVAQLKYQDPSKPADGTQFLAQTAQFQMVEKLQQLSDQNQALLAEQSTMSAIALVGRNVSYGTGTGHASGTVSSVRIGAAGPVLTVGTTDVALSDITEVHAG